VQIGARDRDQDRGTQPQSGEEQLSILLAGATGADHERIPVGIHAADESGGEARPFAGIVDLQHLATLCYYKDLPVFHLIIGHVGAVQMLTHGAHDQLKQVVAVCFGK